MVRSHSSWIEYGEKSTKQFFRLEKMKTNKKAIHRLENEQGELIKTNDGILDELHKFYVNLFVERPVDNSDDFLSDLDAPTVKPENKSILEAPITLPEIEVAVNQLAWDKTPGPNGFPIDFYQKFYPELTHLLHAVYIESDERGELPESALQGVVSLMEMP